MLLSWSIIIIENNYDNLCLEMSDWFLFQNNYIQKCNIWTTKLNNLVLRPLHTNNFRLNFRKSCRAWVQIRHLTASVHNINAFIEPWGILMSRRKNCWEDVEIFQKTSLLELQSYSQLWNFLTMTHILSPIWKQKSLKLTNIWSFLENTKNCQSRKLKDLKLKWKNCICWWSKTIQLLRVRWLRSMNILLLMKS